MPHRRLVQIGKSAPPPPPPTNLPTVGEYFRELVRRQGEDIRLLKERAAALAQERAQRKKSQKSVREESWRLHPMVKTSKKRSAAKRKSSRKPSASRKTSR